MGMVQAKRMARFMRNHKYTPQHNGVLFIIALNLCGYSKAKFRVAQCSNIGLPVVEVLAANCMMYVDVFAFCIVPIISTIYGNDSV